MFETKRINRRKAVSEIISYVLLIVIALGISATVYQWMSTRIPSVSEICPEDISLYIKSYNCSHDDKCSSGNCLNLIIKNNGNFNIDGFFIRTSNNISTIPATGLWCDFSEDCENLRETGRFYFSMITDGFEDKSLGPGNETGLVFNYPSIILLIQIEPFVEGKNSLQICTNAMINIEVDDSKECSLA